MQRVTTGENVEFVAENCLMANVALLIRVHQDVRLAFLLLALLQFLDFLALPMDTFLEPIDLSHSVNDTLR